MNMHVKITDTTKLAKRSRFVKDANEAAQKSVFADYRSRRDQNTLRIQDVNLLTSENISELKTCL
jgi:hypothetical protein